MVVMRLLVDENVPQSVIEVFRARGHEIILVVDLALNASPDHLIGVTGDRLGAIVVTWDQDFRTIAARVSKEGSGRLRRLSRINFRCREPQGAVRADQVIEEIEAMYEIALRKSDKRFLVEIKERNVTYW